jgi:hypothetical protein
VSESEAARVLRIIGKYAWAAADEIEAEAEPSKPEPLDLEAARKEATERRRKLGGASH